MTHTARALWIALILCCPAVATAETIRLDYDAEGAGCPDGGRFRDEVAARLGRVPFDDAALTIVRVRIEPAGDGFAGTLEMPGSGARDFRDNQCAPLAETIASSLATQLDPISAADSTPPVSGTPLAPATAAAATTAPALPDRLGSSWLSGGLSFSRIWRTTSASGLRAAIGYDRRLSAISLGLRVGLVRHEDGLGAATLPFLGARAFWWTQIGSTSRWKVGAGAELWLNSESETGINGEPVFLHVLVETGPRIRLGRAWALDIPVELGVMPFFRPKVYSFQLGAQLVYSM